MVTDDGLGNKLSNVSKPLDEVNMDIAAVKTPREASLDREPE